MAQPRHWIVLGALALGISLGAWIDHSGGELAHSIASGIEAIGTLWLNALRMTVGPLVFSMLVAAVASVSDAMATGRLASRAIGWFTFLLLVAGTLAVLLTQGLLALWPVDRATADAFIAGASQGATRRGHEHQLVATGCSNCCRRTSLRPPRTTRSWRWWCSRSCSASPRRNCRTPQRNALTGFFGAMAEAMVVMVHWVLLVAPIGVFALALGVGRQAGFGAAGLLVQYATTVAAVIAIATLFIYVVVALRGRVSVGTFATAVAPVQVVAASTQSSLATLPAMIECARERLERVAAHRESRAAAGGGRVPLHQPARQPRGLLSSSRRCMASSRTCCR